MVDRVGFRVEGLSHVVRGLRGLGFDVDDLKPAFTKIAAEGAAIVKRDAPKRTGRLAGNARGNRAKSKATVTVGGAAVKYAGPINYGWPKRNIHGAGFMQKADQEMRPKALQMLEDEINASIKNRGF